MHRRIRRPSPSMAVAFTALLVALSGTAWAAIKLPSNSVGTKQIKRNAVTGAKVKDASLFRNDFAAGQIPAGPAGPKGDTGPAGAAGAKGDKGDKGDPGVAPAPEAWQPLPFAAGWSNYPGGAHVPAQFRKDQLGKVHLRGLVTRHAGTPQFDSVIGQLPPGYRPTLKMTFSAPMGEPNGASRVDVDVNGNVRWVTGPDDETDHTGLSNISFWTD